MEVHHHPQLQHKPKPWKEYVLEYIMIVLAVATGFFAESLRENINDHHKEVEFANELYAELKADSIAIQNKITERKFKLRTMDEVCAYLKDSSLTNLSNSFYPKFSIALYLMNRYAFEPKDGILNQLKSSGSLRYFKNVELQKLLGDISVSVSNIRFRNDQEYQYWANPIKPFLLKHYDFNWLNSVRGADDSTAIHKMLLNYLNDGTTGEGVINNLNVFNKSEAINMILFFKQMIISTHGLQFSDYVLTNHKILMLLRKEYHLEKESYD